MASKEGTTINAPSGRIVHGHPCKQVQKKHQDGPQKGQPMFNADGTPAMQYVFGIAWDYATFERDIWPAMAAEAAKGYPNGAPGRFAWKYKRGDQVDDKGKLYSERDGYDGCYVLTVTSNLSDPPPLYAYENNQYRQLTADEIKCGDYVAPQIEFVVNVAQGTNTPSLYVNPRGLVRTGIGAAITARNAFDPTAAYGAGGLPLPPGATATPQMPAGAPAMPGAPPAPGAPQMPGMPPMAPAAAPAPAMAPPPPPAPVAPAGPQRPTDPTHIHAAGTPQEQWWINGAWTPAVAAPAPVAPAAPPAPPAAPQMPPPAHDFVQAATGASGAPPMPGAPPAAPGMPGMLPPR